MFPACSAKWSKAKAARFKNDRAGDGPGALQRFIFGDVVPCDRTLGSMIAVFLHPPKMTASGEDFLVDEPDVVAWWERDGLPGNAALIRVDQLQPRVRDAKLRAALDRMEGFTMVMVVRRA